MVSPPNPINRRKLKTPRAAAIAGILFAVLYGASMALIRISIPTIGLISNTTWLALNFKYISLGLNLVPYSGIAFLWFIGVIQRPPGGAGRSLICNRIPGQRLAFPGFDFRQCGSNRWIFGQLRPGEGSDV